MTTVDRFAPALSPEAVLDRARTFAREGNHDHPLIVVRSQPHWVGADRVKGSETTVRIVATSSPLAVLDALRTRTEREYLLVLTDRTRHELGDAIMLRTRRRDVETLDEWNRVPGLFGAHSVDGRLRTITGSWLPRALMQWQPAGGWPRVPAGVLPAAFAVGALLSRILGHDPSEAIDTAVVLERLDSPGMKERWRDLDDDIRNGLTSAVAATLSPSTSLALRVAERSGPVFVVAIGLALDTLWPRMATAVVNPDQIAARVRIEKLTGTNPDREAVRGFADAAIALTLRWEELSDTAVSHILTQAQAVLADYGWPAGADESTILPAGMTARVREVARLAQLVASGAIGSVANDMERALVRVGEHALASRYRTEQTAAHMAARIARWLRTSELGTAQSLADAVVHYRADSAWVDRAINTVWDASSDANTTQHLASLVTLARERRTADEVASAAVITGDPVDRHDAFGVEHMWERVIRPLSSQHPVLWVVLDGMSAAVASELDNDMARDGWGQVVPADGSGAVTAVATIPSITRLSRASLFSGSLTGGGQDVEKSAVAQRGGVLFHKDDLRSAAGHALAPEVAGAIAATTRSVVAVVLNTIDDALARQDPGGTRWTMQSIQHLRPLLNAAAAAARIVVITSDHGHVVERGGEARPVPGASQRWRAVDSGEPGPGELLVSGPRVLVDGNIIVAAQREDLRYTAKAAGYHGGVSLAELTVPIAVYRPAHCSAPTGWVDAAPAAPRWWNEPLTVENVGNSSVTPTVSLTRRAARPPKPAQGDALFDLTVDDAPPRAADDAATSSLSARLLASEVYASQRARAGRAALDDRVVEALVTALEGGGGRAHRDTLGAAAGVPTLRFDTTIVSLRRLLNVDAYEVVSADPDGVTIHLDIPLLVQQFALNEETT